MSEQMGFRLAVAGAALTSMCAAMLCVMLVVPAALPGVWLPVWLAGYASMAMMGVGMVMLGRARGSAGVAGGR